jgi:hypothetical protein
MVKASRPVLSASCQLLQRARTVGIRLIQNQLYTLREDFRLMDTETTHRLDLKSRGQKMHRRTTRSESEFLYLNVVSRTVLRAKWLLSFSLMHICQDGLPNCRLYVLCVKTGRQFPGEHTRKASMLDISGHLLR